MVGKLYWYNLMTKQRTEEIPSNLESTYKWEDIENNGKGEYFCFPEGIVELRDTALTGKALFAKRDIKEGELIWHYDIDCKETDSLSTAELWAMPREERLEWFVYAWQFETDAITGPKRTNPLDQAKNKDAVNFLNHACDPNVGFDGPLMVRAFKDIPSGTMLTYDYMTSETSTSYPPFTCECGSTNCRKLLSSFDYRMPLYQKKYKGKMFPSVEKVIEIENKAQMGVGPCRELNSKIIAGPCADDVLGRGLFASSFIAKGEPIWIDQSPWNHVEQELSLDQISKLPEESKELAIYYGQEVDINVIRVPKDNKTIEDNLYYLINHSCDPNVAVFSSTMWIAFKDINVGEEINIDYATLGSQIQRISDKCACGSEVCRGSVNLDDWKNIQLQKRYGNAWRPHLLALIWQQQQSLQEGKN